MNTYRFKIENYHSISQADIAINGITVLAGVNGSGKSTLARWLFYLVNFSNAYEVDRYLDYQKTITNLISQYKKIDLPIEQDFNKNIDKACQSISDIPYMSSPLYEKIMEIFSITTNYCIKMIQINFLKMDSNNKTRILNYLQIDRNDGESDTDVLNRYKTEQIQKAKRIKEYYIQLQEQRPIAKLFKLTEGYNENDYPQAMSFQEDGIELINKDSVGTLLGLKSAFFIDTPMALNVSKTDNRFWFVLHNSLKTNTKISKDDDTIRNIQSALRTITGGAITDKEDFLGEKELYFTRESDNLTVKLEQMATGVKSFAYLDRLLENGYLNKDSILILDEPEAHLHPQWIVEYARMLVQIHKETGLYIMLASHDPDMVSAIRYIAEKEDVLKDTAFYLAEQDKNAETFSYKELGLDIEPIFASFNKSFDLIEKYGVDNGI